MVSKPVAKPWKTAVSVSENSISSIRYTKDFNESAISNLNETLINLKMITNSLPVPDQDAVLSEAMVIFATLGVCGRQNLLGSFSSKNIDCLIVDEASQATEAELCVALRTQLHRSC
mmetsp:Transcript_19009/g.47760  ORF Transcript_19009/g.47760 Transcript_19009/m.47760 type:complete len:117 (-) Transcript_19009:1579-1929(-)